MDKTSFTLFALLWLTSSLNAQHGYASMNGGTTGGEGGDTIYVSTKTKLQSAVTGDAPRIIKITKNIATTRMIRVGSNKTILGTTSTAGLSGPGFLIRQVRNVIVRGLLFANPIAPSDSITIQRSTNVWVDHNEFHSDLLSGHDFYDGLVDVTHGSDFITISWNTFHDHFKVSLVGHSDTNGAQDRGKLRITYDHNWFYNVGERLPSLRFGTGHIFNNVFEDVLTSGINSRMGAQVLVESNSFTNANTALTTHLFSVEQGYAVERDNLWRNAAPDITQCGNFTYPPYYVIVEDAGSMMVKRVKAEAGNTIDFL